MKKSFTYIELLVVLAIMSLVMAISIMKIGSLSQIKEKNELNSLIRDMKHARILAMSKRKNVYFSFNDDLKSYNISYSPDEKNNIVKEKTLKYLKLKDYNFDKKTIVFELTGAPKKAGTLIIAGKDKSYTITVEIATSKINIKEITRR